AGAAGGGGAVRPARRSLRGIRARARLRPSGPLPQRSVASVLRMTGSAAACRAALEAALAGDPAAREMRRPARRALYRLSQRGVTAAPRPASRAVVERRAERPARA